MKVELGESVDYIAALQERMARAEVSAADLARATGISPSQFSRWFNTSRQPGLRNVAKIEEAMRSLSKRGRRRGGS